MGERFDMSRPIYAQIVERLKAKILAGIYPPGGHLDSVRDMAAAAGVNPNTMQRALQELESRGLLQAQRTAGRTVTADDTALQALRRRRAGTLAAEFLHQMQALGLTEAEIETLLRETAQQAPKKE
jgi:DNA-binding transcriptional regulator YhcF (GntR family)